MDLTFTFVLAGIGAALVTAFIAGITYYDWKRKAEEREPTLQDRISDLTKNLKSSVAVITEIETEISKRKELAQHLEADIERYEKLKEISKEQMEAVSQILRIPLQKESRKSLIINGIINFVVAFGFFIIGYFIGGR